MHILNVYHIDYMIWSLYSELNIIYLYKCIELDTNIYSLYDVQCTLSQSRWFTYMISIY